MASESPWRRRFRRLRQIFLAGLTLFVAFAVFIIADGWVAFGKGVEGARLARVQANPQWDGDHFVNIQPMWNDVVGGISAFLHMSPAAEPSGPIPTVDVDDAILRTPPASKLRLTWMGHSTVVIEIDGLKVLTDPIFDERASPYTWVGPKRWYDPPAPLERFVDVDVVLISHDHHDHLQYETIAAMKHWPATFVVPLGVGAHLEYWGIPAAQIVELEWWQSKAFTPKGVGTIDDVGTVDDVKDVVIHATPARHASGRQVLDQNATLWASYAIVGPSRRLFFSGDTGMHDNIKVIGERFGPFDITMVEAGAYSAAWPDWHMGPEQAVDAHTLLQGKLFVPIHWGLWNLATHGWTEPAERVFVAAEAHNVTFAMPRPGESVDVDSPAPPTRWWPKEPWETVPVISTVAGEAR